jgi:hypothetical protein
VGFAPFQAIPATDTLRRPRAAPDLSRVRSSHPPELFPRPQPYHVTMALAFSLFPDPRPRPPVDAANISVEAAGNRANLKAFLQGRIRCLPRRCRRRRPDALLGFVPLQGSPSDPGACPKQPPRTALAPSGSEEPGRPTFHGISTSARCCGHSLALVAPSEDRPESGVASVPVSDRLHALPKQEAPRFRGGPPTLLGFVTSKTDRNNPPTVSGRGVGWHWKPLGNPLQSLKR